MGCSNSKPIINNINSVITYELEVYDVYNYPTEDPVNYGKVFSKEEFYFLKNPEKIYEDML